VPRSADLDRGDPVVDAGKRAEMLDAAEKVEREADRAGLRDLDRRIEQTPGLSRFRRDQSRILPRDATGGAVRRRRLPADDRPRRLTVYRQRILTSKRRPWTDAAFQSGRTGIQRDVRRRRRRPLREVNNQLSEHVGDVDQLDDDKRHVTAVHLRRAVDSLRRTQYLRRKQR